VACDSRCFGAEKPGLADVDLFTGVEDKPLLPWATNERAVAERGLTEALLSGDVRRSVRYFGADLGVFFLVPEGFLLKSRGSSKALDGLPRPSSTGLKAAHSSNASLMWGWTKDDSFLRWNWALRAKLRSTRSDADVS
jgi:hypothetical protein